MDRVSTWGEAMFASTFAALQALFNKIPQILGFVVILVLGWIVASFVATAIAALLRSVRFNELATNSGFTGFVKNMGVETDAAGFIATVVKWFVRLIALVVAFDALGLPAVSDVLRQLLLFLPNLVVGIVVLVLGGLAAKALSSLVQGAATQAELSNPQLLATVAKVAVWSFAVVVAVNQIGIAQTLVNTLFMGVVGALALALGLSFGLGGRETAAALLRDWYEKSRGLAGTIEKAAHTGPDAGTPATGRIGGHPAGPPSNGVITASSSPPDPVPAGPARQM